ncbi:hypothetical protein F7725_025643 [Dissostichus mawsoni]|uniref:Uncharacterized protein n=1 Tax=Dissostichus mawsoni TaxID=36200 RepID=A0A7J5XCN1_DISMA|nr:hypothetical protein F7725_025643 [Dissostichus mawsoni]
MKAKKLQRKVDKLKVNKGKEVSVRNTKRDKKKIAEEKKERVVGFLCRAENSRMLSGRKTVTKNKMKHQRRVLLHSLKDLHSNYNTTALKHHAVSYRQFLRYCPFMLLKRKSPTETPKSTVNFSWISEEDIEKFDEKVPEVVPAVKGTMKLHQVISTKPATILYRDISCFCSRPAAICKCYNPSTVDFRNASEVPEPPRLNQRGKFIVVNYEGKPFVVGDEIEVSCMKQLSAKNVFTWPHPPDLLFYYESDPSRELRGLAGGWLKQGAGTFTGRAGGTEKGETTRRRGNGKQGAGRIYEEATWRRRSTVEVLLRCDVLHGCQLLIDGGDLRGDLRGNLRGDLRGDLRGNSRGDSRGDWRRDSRGDLRGNSRGDSRGDWRRNLRGNSRRDSRGDLRGDLRGNSRGDSRGDWRRNLRGNSRRDSRGDLRGDSRGNSRRDSRGDLRGDSRGDSRGNSREDSRRDLRGNSRGDLRGD